MRKKWLIPHDAKFRGVLQLGRGIITEMIFQVSIITSIPRKNSLENFLVKLDYVLDGHVAGIARSAYVSDSLLG